MRRSEPALACRPRAARLELELELQFVVHTKTGPESGAFYIGIAFCVALLLAFASRRQVASCKLQVASDRRWRRRRRRSQQAGMLIAQRATLVWLAGRAGGRPGTPAPSTRGRRNAACQRADELAGLIWVASRASRATSRAAGRELAISVGVAAIWARPRLATCSQTAGAHRLPAGPRGRPPVRPTRRARSAAQRAPTRAGAKLSSTDRFPFHENINKRAFLCANPVQPSAHEALAGRRKL